MKHTVIIADDHPIFRSGIREVIKSLFHLELKGEASDGLQAYRLILAQQPDVAVLDLEMPELSGLDVCQKLAAEKARTKCIILTMHKEKYYFDQAMQAGVMGYLLKDNAVEEVVKCIESVLRGNKYASPQIEDYLISHEEQQQPALAQLSLLSATEKIILKLISQGKTTPQIAENLFVSEKTIENHRYNIAKKLQLEAGKNSLLKFAMTYKGVL